jgi:hypothetical protein
MTTVTLAPTITKAHFKKGDTVHILPFDGFPPRRHAGENGIVRRVLKLFDHVDHCHIYDYWVEIGKDAWLYSESALEVAL